MKDDILIPLSRGKAAIVDPDFAYLADYKWICQKNGYAARDVGGRKNKKRIYMHRLIMNAQKGEIVDHKNHDTLDNRKINLRICTQVGNGANQKCRNPHGFKGVTLIKSTGKFMSQCAVGGRKYLGVFNTPEEAGSAYEEYVSKIAPNLYRTEQASNRRADRI